LQTFLVGAAKINAAAAEEHLAACAKADAENKPRPLLSDFLVGGPKISAAAKEKRMANPAAAVAAAAARAAGKAADKAAKKVAKAAAVARISGWVEELAALPGAAAAWAAVVNAKPQLYWSPFGSSNRSTTAFGIMLEAVAASSTTARCMVGDKDLKGVDMRAAIVGWWKHPGNIPAAVRAAGLMWH
jgi:hypothetical protein